MLDQLRQRLTYANVMATVAVFIALGGSSYAALQIDSGDIANNSVRGVDVRNRTLSDRDVKRNGLTGRSIRESRLGRVPRAREADRLGDLTAADLLLRCPDGTFVIADVCVETTPRSAVVVWRGGGRLRDYGANPESRSAASDVRGAASGAQRRPARRQGANSPPRSIPRPRCQASVDVLVVTDQGGSVALAAEHRSGRQGIPLRRPTPGTDPMRDHANTEGVRCHR